MNELDQYRLTDVEIDSARRTDALRHDYSINTRAIADTATEKALRGVVALLRGYASKPEEGQSAISAYQAVADELDTLLGAAKEQPRG